jgi:hypothetical protein
MAVLASLLAAGCGGGSSGSGSAAQYSVSVAVSGLSGTVGVAMGGSTLTFTSDGTSAFSSEVAAGGTYAVTVSIQPSTQYCTVNNGTAIIHADVTVDVTCNASAGGVWQATNQNANNTTETYVAMADEQGDFWLLDTNTNNTNNNVNYAYVYGGSLAVNGTTVSVSDTGEALTGTYSDSSSYGSGTMSGTVDARSMLTLTSTFKTTSGTQLPLPQTPLTLAYNTLYSSQGSSLADVTGNYLENSLTVNIASGGALTGRDSFSGCILTGTVSPIASEYDMYDISYTYSECNMGVNNPLEGQTFEGIGAFEPANGNTAAQFIAVEAAILTTGYIYSALDLFLQ